MGMQVHFKFADVLHARYDLDVKHEETFKIVRVLNPHGGEICSFILLDDQQSCYSDIGSLGQCQTELLFWLVRNRICFTAS